MPGYYTWSPHFVKLSLPTKYSNYALERVRAMNTPGLECDTLPALRSQGIPALLPRNPS